MSEFCIVSGCTNFRLYRLYCKKHYDRWYRSGRLEKRPLCTWPGGCKRRPIKPNPKGYCVQHAALRTPYGEPRRNNNIAGERNPNWRGGTSEYRNHGQFKRVRLQVLEACGWKCANCGGMAQQVHHDGDSKHIHDPRLLVPLCRSCHHKKHPKKTSKYKRRFGYTLKQMALMEGVSVTTIKNRVKRGRHPLAHALQLYI